MVFKALPYSLKLLLLILVKLHKNPPSKRRQLKCVGDDLWRKTVVFDVEGTLLRSWSLFPYFMVVALEGGSLIRAFVLFLVYPLVWLADEEVSLKIMVMVSFLGMRKEGFRIGSSVLPKLLLEDVGAEAFDVLSRGKKRVAVSRLPRVMVETFLREYMETDHVFGRELIHFRGCYVGLMKQHDANTIKDLLQGEAVVCFSNKSLKHDYWVCSKEVYVVSNGEKAAWKSLPRERYPKALTFHDGRLAFRPEAGSMAVMFMWSPLGVFLSVLRTITALSLPYGALIPILAFTGMRLKLSGSGKQQDKFRQGPGRLYVCNHRTLLDPLYVSFGLKKPLGAVTYSLSRMSEMLSPIKTVRLTRDREQDARLMERMLESGDVVVCPEGTTCREPYLLRFSPLFAQLGHRIVPVALDTHVTMFYGTTASGRKWLDPFVFMMNPRPAYRVCFLEELSSSGGGGGIDVANHVQSEIGNTLGFQCTTLTRKHKYLVLAGNQGLV